MSIPAPPEEDVLTALRIAEAAAGHLHVSRQANYRALELLGEVIELLECRAVPPPAPPPVCFPRATSPASPCRLMPANPRSRSPSPIVVSPQSPQRNPNSYRTDDTSQFCQLPPLVFSAGRSSGPSPGSCSTATYPSYLPSSTPCDTTSDPPSSTFDSGSSPFIPSNTRSNHLSGNSASTSCGTCCNSSVASNAGVMDSSLPSLLQRSCSPVQCPHCGNDLYFSFNTISSATGSRQTTNTLSIQQSSQLNGSSTGNESSVELLIQFHLMSTDEISSILNNQSRFATFATSTPNHSPSHRS